MEMIIIKFSKFCFVLRGSLNNVLCFAEALFLQKYATTLPEFLLTKHKVLKLLMKIISEQNFVSVKLFLLQSEVYNIRK
jgi:hypothetical protein